MSETKEAGASGGGPVAAQDVRLIDQPDAGPLNQRKQGQPRSENEPDYDLRGTTLWRPEGFYPEG